MNEEKTGLWLGHAEYISGHMCCNIDSTVTVNKVMMPIVKLTKWHVLLTMQICA